MIRGRCTIAVLMVLVTVVSGCSRKDSGEDTDTDEPRGASQTEVPGESEHAPKAVTVDAAEQARLGVIVTKLSEVPAPSGSPTTARVLDPAPLLALDGELAAASASLDASRAEAERTRQLFNEDRTASAHSLEMATAQAQADRQRVESARRRIALEWGDGIANLAPERRTGLLGDLAQVRAELIRVELPLGMAAPKRDSAVAIRIDPDSPELQALVLGTLPEADPRLQTRGLLVELRGSDANLAIGRMLLARIAGRDSAMGVLLPRSALIRKDSRVWAYVQTAPTTFMRREVTEYQPVAEGWFVRRGFAAGDALVTAGAASLFAIEAPAPAAD
jgi:hypothetical protein